MPVIVIIAAIRVPVKIGIAVRVSVYIGISIAVGIPLSIQAIRVPVLIVVRNPRTRFAEFRFAR
jgi:hypothetical protein